MDHQLKKQDSQSGEKTLSQVTDPKLIEVSREIFAEITKVHKSLNERRLNRLIDKNALVCQNSTELEKMFKVRWTSRLVPLNSQLTSLNHQL